MHLTVRSIENNVEAMNNNDQGTEFEFTVIQKLHQGSLPKKRSNSCPNDFSQAGFSGLFFCFFFGEAKKKKNLIPEYTYDT